MRVAVQQEELQLLAKTLQEQILAKIPSGQLFQVKCALNNGELMILTQHPANVKVDLETVLQLLEETLQSLPSYWEQPAVCFLRVSGEKRPYAQRLLAWNEQRREEQVKVDEGDIFQKFTDIPLTFSSSEHLGAPREEAFEQTRPETAYIYESDSGLGAPEEEIFDPLAGGPDLLTVKPQRPIKPILLGAALGAIALLGTGAYLLTRPCVTSECPELQTAKQINTESRQLIGAARSEQELALVQQKLETASLSLGTIPSWSPRHQEREELKTSLLQKSEKINTTIKALQTATVAEQSTQTPAKSIEELQARQQIWRQAIAPLEGINADSELYGLVQPKLLNYRTNLAKINQQLLTEEKWLKKLSAAKAVASVAIQRETTAKSLTDWQKVQSTWQVVINALNIIPQTSSGYQPAQKLLVEYKPKLAAARDRATLEQLAFKTYQQATGTANQAKVAENNKQWQAAVVRWGQALQAAKQISRESFYYNQAQSLITPYSTNLKQAQEKFAVTGNLQQTQADLQKTCTREIRICTFTINNRAIIVQLTREYDQVRQSSLIDPSLQDPTKAMSANNHWYNLQDALAVISDNASLSLLVYDSQGRPVYNRSRVG
ncbi:hypothetical protein [Fortiea contorta]|uniref:hypothetical protein n=1 Tax=Fortiea contorta TaxID=1892405 RepID=UPI00034DE1E1|nr:hypothetical protein [Fortiea contorta]